MPDFTLSLHAGIDEIGAADWDRCAGPDNPFLGHAFLSALEDSGSTGPETGWIPRHAAFRDAGGTVRAVAPLYGKLHSQGEYVFDHGWARALEQAGGRYYPKLQAAVPFSPVTGPRLLCAPPGGEPAPDIALLADALPALCGRMKLSSAHVTFCEEAEWRELGARSNWLCRTGLQFHWLNRGYADFEDFLGGMASRKRKSIRRERRDANAAGLRFHALRGREITEAHWDAFHGFYLSTVDRKWGEAYLRRGFFSLLGERLGDRVLLMLAEHGGKPVAGALNLIGADALYGRNWGAAGEWPFLHFELCYYRAIDFAIEHKLARVEAGAQGEHKIQRGYLPRPTYSAHWIAHAGLRRAVAEFLERERAALAEEETALLELSPFRTAGAPRADD